jgi:nucleotide-binding universal stress UspA family protein
MIRQILFPTDFSPSANHAFPAVLRLAAHFGAEVTTVHTYLEPSISPGYLTHTIEEILESIKLEAFEHIKDKLPLLHAMAADLGLGDIQVRHALSPGRDIIQGLTQSAGREKGDLIVMGTSGVQGIQELFKGSVASEVMENAPCPVLVIPQTTGLSAEVMRIVYAIGEGPHEAAAQTWIKQFAIGLGATLVWTNQPGVDFNAFADFQASQQDISINQHFAFCASWEAADDLLSFLKAEQADLLALQVQQTGFFHELFQQNFGKHLAKSLNFPLLGIPDAFLAQQPHRN